jgi:23S rRNA (uracil1939-C5)-methyltransferase
LKTLRPGTRFQLKIDRLSVGGRGVGRHEGIVVFVADVIAGESVEVELTKVKKNFAEAKLLEVRNPSPWRVKPPCPYVGTCGGCSWQHIAYEEQLRTKRELVIESLTKFSGFDVSAPGLVGETVPSPLQFRYRNRVQVHLERGAVGFHQRSSNRIVPIVDCLITDERLCALFSELRSPTWARKADHRVELFLSERLQASIRGTEGAEDETAFSQVNSGQNEHLIDYVLNRFRESVETLKEAEASVPSRDEGRALHILDLYAGNGNFTLPLARAFPQASIGSAELNPRSVKQARERAQAEFPGRTLDIEEADVADTVAHHPAIGETIVLLDPPRVGCAPEVMAALAEARPPVVIYVSCHPVTLARDLKALANGTYRIASVQPFDMFPQTDHVETVVVMHRQDVSRPC